MAEDVLFEQMIQDFNFYKVREVMRFLDWKWFDSCGDVPTVSMMKDAVVSLYKSAVKGSISQESQYTVSSGGFSVTVDFNNNTASLSFAIEETDAGFD